MPDSSIHPNTVGPTEPESDSSDDLSSPGNRNRKEEEQQPKSYYDDDATGYEVYDPRSDKDEDEDDS